MKKMLQFYFSIICMGIIIGVVVAGPGSLLNIGNKKAEPHVNNNDYFGHWAEKYIEEAIVMGIVNGYPDGSFKPDEPVSRAVFAVMLNKFIKNRGEEKDHILLSEFNDYAEVPEWARTGLQKAVSLGLLEAYPDNTIRPMEPLNQSDIFKIVPKDKIPENIFRYKNNTVVTRAEACVVISGLRFSEINFEKTIASTIDKSLSERIS